MTFLNANVYIDKMIISSSFQRTSFWNISHSQNLSHHNFRCFNSKTCLNGSVRFPNIILERRILSLFLVEQRIVLEPVIYVGESHVSERRSVVTWRPCSWDYRKTDCQITANKEGSGEVNKNITTKTRAFTTDKKETEIENCKFQRKTRLIRVLHRCAHPPQATKFGHFVILFQKDGKVIYYESIINYHISLSFPLFSLYADILYNFFLKVKFCNSECA